MAGALECNLPVFTCSGTGGNASGAASLPLLTCEATGTLRSGSLAASLPALTCTATGLTGVVGSLRAALPLLTLSATGLTGIIGRMAADLPALTMAATGRTLANGVGSLLLPMLQITAHGEEVVASFVALVMNPRNFTVSEYEGFSFNSFALFNGQYIGAGPAGIYVIGSGNKDGSSNIDAELKTGQLAMDGAKPRDVYLVGKSSGQMLVTLSENEDSPNNAKVDYLLETLGIDRAKVPRGMKPDYLQVGVKNVSGCDFDLDSMEIYVEGLSRKKK